MFGHQDDQPAQETAVEIPEELVNEAPAAEEVDSGQPSSQPSGADSSAPADIVKPDPTDGPADDGAPEPDKATDQAASPPPADDHNDPAGQHPGTPMGDENGHEHISDIISPAGGFPKRTSYQYPDGSTNPSDSSISPGYDDAAVHELIDIKQHALGELAPLIDQLDLPPEEKFHAIMMVIQATDDQTLIKAAYAAAHSIEDEKIRGQALLSIVNEINYFTQQPETDQ
jgi:hypothetical protein